MAKRIKLTEEQLKVIINLITEETYDQALTTHQREKSREIFMSHEDAKLMHKLASEWCGDKASHPDCEELNELGKKLKIDTF